jgi:hypothetical protein
MNGRTGHRARHGVVIGHSARQHPSHDRLNATRGMQIGILTVGTVGSASYTWGW